MLLSISQRDLHFSQFVNVFEISFSPALEINSGFVQPFLLSESDPKKPSTMSIYVLSNDL